MLIDYQKIETIYLVCGKTDLRQGIDGLANIIQNYYQLELYQSAIFLFCGNRKDRYKLLYWDNNGFYLIYKRLDSGHLQWPRHSQDIIPITHQQLRWLLEGLTITPNKVIKSLPIKGKF